uniref:Uncharacterized protein n=1 Tax=Clastoptera arizonana TaxID=38151 RepID=A0A1B6CVH6_9HEMI
MGNVLASSKPPLPEKDIGLPPLKTYPKDEDNNNEKIENPGTVEELHKKCKDVFPINFGGAKIVLNKGLSNHFQVSHTINLSSSDPGSYKFGATYVGTKVVGPGDACPLLLGDIDASGNLNANIIHQFGQRLRLKFQSQVQRNTFVAYQLTGDYRGDSYTGSLTVANPNIINKTGILVAHYLQNVTSRIALGTELIYQCSPHIPGGQIAILSMMARYTDKNSQWSTTFGQTKFQLCYYAKASEQLQFGVELESNFRLQESCATIAYQVDLPKADLNFKGMIDSNWNVGAVLEKKMLPLPFTLSISGLLNHHKNLFQLGLGFVLG